MTTITWIHVSLISTTNILSVTQSSSSILLSLNPMGIPTPLETSPSKFSCTICSSLSSHRFAKDTSQISFSIYTEILMTTISSLTRC